MSDDPGFAVFAFGVLGGIFAGAMFVLFNSTGDARITSGAEFVIGSGIYKCSKTHELESASSPAGK